jgi:hypothetical protein
MIRLLKLVVVREPGGNRSRSMRQSRTRLNVWRSRVYVNVADGVYNATKFFVVNRTDCSRLRVQDVSEPHHESNYR